MKNTNEQKYYLRDTALTSVDDDFFRHQDVTNNIIKILETTNPPYNIAVIGKWGLGKSSLINMVSKYIKDNPEHYLKVEINAWKYEKEVLAKVFLRQVTQGIESKKIKKTEQERVQANFLELTKEFFAEKVKSAESVSTSLIHFVKKYTVDAILLLAWMVLTYIGFYVYKLADYSIEPLAEGANINLNIFVDYCEHIGKLIIIPVVLKLIMNIIDGLKEKGKRSLEVKLPTIGVEDYEIYLQREIDKKIGVNENFKIVIILDDLDRLSIPKMVEALDAIKMFIDYKNCIFIVPFDDAILKNAIQKKRLNPNDDIDIQSELLLDKLFQYKVYLPQLLTHDIKKYSEQLCQKQIPDFVREYMNNDWTLFNDILRHILIHNEIETPRQVKKIVNAFISNMMIARGRQNAGHTEPNFATKKENVNMIAKISVLQSDFNEFYDLLFIVDNAIELSIDAYQGKIHMRELPSELKKYFGITSKNENFPKSALPLMNFLLSTSRYKVESIYPYLYMAMDDISIKTGSKRQQEFRKTLLSRNFTAIREQLQGLPELFNVGIHILNDENDLSDITNAFLGIISAYDLKPSTKNVLKTLAKVCDEVVAWMDSDDEEYLSFENMLMIYNECDTEEKVEIEKLLSFTLVSQNKNNIFEKTKVFAANYQNLSANLLTEFNNFIKYILDEKLISSNDFITVKNACDLDYNNIWGMSYYTYIIDAIADEGDFSDRSLTDLRNIYEYIAETNTVDSIFNKLEKLYGAIELAGFFVELLSLDVSSSISLRTRSKLIESQLEINEGDTPKINPLFLWVSYNVSDEKVAFCDDYFSKHCESNEFGKLIQNYCKNNDISLLKKSIGNFINYLFENVSDASEKVLGEIIDLLDNTQLESLKKMIDSTMTYNSSKTSYTNIGNLLEIYSKKKERFEIIKPVILRWTSHMQTTSTVTMVYVDFILECVCGIVQYFEDVDRTKVFEAIIAKITSGKISDLGVNIVCNMSQYMSNADYEKIAAALCKNVNEENCIPVFYLMEEHWEEVSKSDDFGDYVKVMLLAVKDERYINDIIEKVAKHFSNISDETLRELIITIINSEKVDFSMASNAVRKYIDNRELKSAATLILELLERSDEVKIAEIFRDCEKNSLRAIADYIISISGEYRLENLLSLVECILNSATRSMNKQINDLIATIAHRVQTEDDISKLHSILDRINKDQYSGVSKQYATVFAMVFQKTSSREIKQSIAEKAKLLRIFKDIKVLLDENTKMEWLNYSKKDTGE